LALLDILRHHETLGGPRQVTFHFRGYLNRRRDLASHDCMSSQRSHRTDVSVVGG
jgi:hypothetical protein